MSVSKKPQESEGDFFSAIAPVKKPGSTSSASEAPSQPPAQTAVVATPASKELRKQAIRDEVRTAKQRIRAEHAPPEGPSLFPVPKRATITIYGAKGSSKTMLSTYIALASSKGKILIITFETTATRNTIDQFFDKFKDRIDVLSLDRLFDFNDSDEMLKTMSVAVDTILDELRTAEQNPYSWVILEGLQELNQVAEGKMRYMNQLTAYQGVKNRNLWKERKLYLTQIYKAMHRASKNGVIFTSQEVTIEDEDGNRKEPAWYGIIKEQTDITIETRKKVDFGLQDSQVRFFAIIRDDKITGKTGQCEVTNKPQAIVEWFRSAQKPFEIVL